MRDIVEYFEEERNLYLVKVEYHLNDEMDEDIPDELTLDCEDSVTAEVYSEEAIVRVVFTRNLSFSPVGPYGLTVAFGLDLMISDEYVDTVDWDELNLAEEIMEDGGDILNELIARTSLLIGQITSSYGQAPLLTPSAIESE